MPLNVGSRLGHYDVTALIGEGGMGQVYQATDTKLNRQVALKILPEAFATDPDRLARFQREAQVLASLNHPGIAAIYGIEESEDTRALVLELVEGPTLADRIAQGPIPIDDALPIAKQIAEALEAAHEAGVIHRDLKPVNIKVKDDGTVKVLDFGLAKALDTSPQGDPSQSPTLTAAATQMGVIMGTAAYMSPEQARGKPVDKRADIWSFGAVLFEMLTGRRAFAGEDVSVTLAEVIKSDPDFEALPDDVPARVRNALRVCLQKDPRQRGGDVGAIRLALEGAFETGNAQSASKATPTPEIRQRAVPIAIAVVAALGIAGMAVWSLARPDPIPLDRVARFSVPLPADQLFSFTNRHVVAISPDSSHVAYTANQGLWLRPIDQSRASLVRGTEAEARTPFFSPNGEWIGFFAAGQLKKVSLTDGALVTLCEAENPFGVSWGVDDMILYGQGAEGIWRVPGTGGPPEQVIAMEEGEQAHGPQMLPGGEWVLYTLQPGGSSSWDVSQVVIQSVASGARTVLVEGGRDARYLATGHLVYGFEETLQVQAFDLDQLAMRGGPLAVVERVRTSGRSSGAMQFSVSRDGSLAYIPGSSFLRGGVSLSPVEARLVWVDRQGEEEALDLPAAAYARPQVSPDGTRVAVEISEGDTSSIWIADLTRGTRGRMTFGATNDFSPLWTPDGQQVVFTSDRDGELGLFRKSADGTGDVEHLVTIEDAAFLRASDWSQDGNRLVFHVVPENTSYNVYVLSMEGERTWEPLVDGNTNEYGPVISPDGEWVAYVAGDTGRPEVHVGPFSDFGSRQPVSTDGGVDPTWSPDGGSLFYIERGDSRRPVNAMMVVAIDPGPPLDVGIPEVLFDHSNYARPANSGLYYDIAPDGRFMMVKESATADDSDGLGLQIEVVLNWQQELLERVPVP